MPISQTTITGSVKTPAGADAAITGVTFTLSGSDFEAGEIVAVNTVVGSVVTASGDFEVELWPNDVGLAGNTFYTMAFTFDDGSKVTAQSKIFVTYSPTPKTIEDVAFETVAAGSVKPNSIRFRTAAEFANEATHPVSTYTVIRG